MHCACLEPVLCLVDLCRAVPLILILYLPTSISGTLPPDVFSNFGTIIHLELDRTALSGTLPPQFSEMTKLRYLELYSTVISGTVPPTAFSNMPQARAVHVALTSTWHSRPRGTHVHMAHSHAVHVALTRRPRGTHTPSTWQIYDLEIASCELSGTLPASVYALGARGAPTTSPPPLHSSRHV